MSEKKKNTVTVEASIPAEFAGPVAVEASRRNLSVADFIGAAAISAIVGVTHPFVVGIFGKRRDEMGSEEQEL